MLVRKNADNTIRWKEGERLDHLFEQRCDQFTGSGTRPGGRHRRRRLTFRELDDRANQVARYLIDQGIEPGDRVGLLFDKTVDTYVALLAVLKINAAYVPLDAGFPDRAHRASSCGDADVKAIVSMSTFRGKLDAFDVRQIFLDAADARDRRTSRRRASPTARSAPPVDQLCYIIYTSGTTGNAEGRRDRASRASAISSGSPPRSTASRPATASTRA